MAVSTGVEKLQQAVVALRKGGRSVVQDLVHELHDVEQTASTKAFDDLARLCRVGAETISAMAETDASYESNAPVILEHLDQLTGFAQQLLQGGVVDGVEVPKLLTLADPDDEQHFHETVGMFVTHAIGSLAELEEDILAVESQADPSESIGSIRRVVHTLKAEFGVLQMDTAKSLCHQAETAVDVLIEQKCEFPIDLMLEIADWLKQFLDRLTKDARAAAPDAKFLQDKLTQIIRSQPTVATVATVDNSGPVDLTVGGDFADSLNEFITEARAHLSDAEGAMVAFENDHTDTEQINLTFRGFHTIKGVAGFLNLTPIVQLAHAAETLLDAGRSNRIQLVPGDVDLILSSGDLISQMLNALEGQKAPSVQQHQNLITALAQAVQKPRTVTAEVEAPAAVAPTPVASTAATDAAAAPLTIPTPAIDPPAARTDEARPAVEGEHKAAKVERTVKVSTTRLDMLVDMVGELVIAQSMVLQDKAIQCLESQSLARNISQVGKITRDLQGAAMSLRMVTLKSTFQKMARLVRDVASKSAKKVQLTIQGEDTELDRNVVEQISDPLVHMIRNSIDHGIEKPDERRKAGKVAEGQLLLRAYHQGGSIVIEITDDGRGIPRQKVFDKAIERELVAPGTRLEDMTDAEIFGLIFLPGFSTAEKVTDLSGRGVGMDVVRRNIEALRGKVEIESREGNGTTFRMRLPLTLAIIDGMVVRVGHERYVVPTLSIEQSFRPDSNDVHHLVDRGECVQVRGAVLPIYRLHNIFCVDSDNGDLNQGILIVVEVDGDRSCLLVDEILGQQQVVIKSLGVQGQKMPGVSGGAIMGDGKIALILDVGSLVEAAVGV